MPPRNEGFPSGITRVMLSSRKLRSDFPLLATHTGLPPSPALWNFHKKATVFVIAFYLVLL